MPLALPEIMPQVLTTVRHVMVDINFDCPQCGQNLDAPEDMVGLFIECPACTKVVQVPKPAADTEFRPAPPRPTEDGDEGEKSSTIRIQLPPGLGVPEKRQRRIVIKRLGRKP